jgi:hypothetical protein
MPLGAAISLIAKTTAIVALGAVLSSCAASSRVDGVLPSWANPQPQMVEPAQNGTKNSTRQAEALKKRDRQISQIGSKPETTSQNASEVSQTASEE